MSYYFVIVGTLDNPLYELFLPSKSAAAAAAAGDRSSSSSSFFSSSSNPVALSTPPRGSAADVFGDGAGGERNYRGSGGSSVFGLGGAFGALGLGGGGGAGGTGSIGALTGGAHAGSGLGIGKYTDRHVMQIVAHSSLDVVEEVQFLNGAMYHKTLDRVGEWVVSAFITPNNVKFIILHETKNDDGIRHFFTDVWETFVKTLMNPFHSLNDPIQSTTFDARVRASAKKNL